MLGGPCGCPRVNRMEKNVSQAERGRLGCREAHTGALEATEDSVLRWETTKRWRQSPEKPIQLHRREAAESQGLPLPRATQESPTDCE